MLSNVSITKQCLHASIALIGLCATIIVMNQFIRVMVNPQQKIMGAALTRNLDQEHTAVMNGIRDEFNIAHDEWQQLMDEFAQVRQKYSIVVNNKITAKKNSDPLTNHIKDMLADGYINPNAVEIAYQPNKGCPLLAIQEFDGRTMHHKIAIDKEWLQARAPHIQDAIIKHEMQHLKHMDSIEGGYIIDFLQEKGYSRADYEKSRAVHAYRHHRELRADLLAAAGHMQTAQALQEDFAQSMAKNYQEDLRTHPASKTRYQEMTQLIAHMQQENAVKTA